MDFKRRDKQKQTSSTSSQHTAIDMQRYGSADITLEYDESQQQVDSSSDKSDKNNTSGNSCDDTFSEKRHHIRKARAHSGCFTRSFISTYIALSILWITVIVSTFSMPVIMIIVGLVYVDDCPHDPGIPLIFVVMGISMSLSNVINTADKNSTPKLLEDQRRRKLYIGILNMITNCFSFVCFIAACIWVYGEGIPSFHKTSPNYCHPILYHFTFWVLNIAFIFIGFLVIIGLIGFALAYFIK